MMEPWLQLSLEDKWSNEEITQQQAEEVVISHLIGFSLSKQATVIWVVLVEDISQVLIYEILLYHV